MITAIVFVQAETARIPEVASAIAALDGVSEVYSVTGQIDLIALVRVRNHEDIAAVVSDKLNKVEGVVDTETHIAYRAYSRHDLEAAFSIGSIFIFEPAPPGAEKPPALPLLPSTRWQGTISGIGLAPSAAPTARDKATSPSRRAISP